MQVEPYLSALSCLTGHTLNTLTLHYIKRYNNIVAAEKGHIISEISGIKSVFSQISVQGLMIKIPLRLY